MQWCKFSFLIIVYLTLVSIDKKKDVYFYRFYIYIYTYNIIKNFNFAENSIVISTIFGIG